MAHACRQSDKLRVLIHIMRLVLRNSGMRHFRKHGDVAVTEDDAVDVEETCRHTDHFSPIMHFFDGLAHTGNGGRIVDLMQQAGFTFSTRVTGSAMLFGLLGFGYYQGTVTT